MLKAFYRYELKKLLSQPAPYFYFVVFFVIALASMLGSAGYFDPKEDSDSKIRLLNSPYEINSIFQYFNKLFLFLLPAIIGMVIYRDFRNNLHPILYTFPFKKSEYLLGKFLSGLTVVTGITFSVGAAFMLGEYILGSTNPAVGPFNFWAYANTYFLFVFPNMISFGLMVFIAVASLRNIYAGFIAVILLVFVQVMADNLFAGNPVLFALLDPFGQNSVAMETRYWTIDEQNVQQVPILGMVLWNRIFWIALGLLSFGFFYKKFQLEQETFRLWPKIFKGRIPTPKTFFNASVPTFQENRVTIDLTLGSQLRAMLKLSLIDFRYIVKNWLFHLLLVLGVLVLVFTLSKVTNRGDFTFLPLTRIMLSVPMFFFSTVIVLLTFIYSGMLVHRPGLAKASQLIDSTATSNWVLLGSKILALLQLQLFMLSFLMVCGIGLQVYNGYYHFEIGLYIFHLLLITFPVLMVWAALSVFTHTIIPNLYLGIFLLLMVWLGIGLLPQIGLMTHLFRFNSPPQLIYSDLNGYGDGLSGSYLVNTYWLSFAAILVILAFLFWQRGFGNSVQERFRTAVQRFRSHVPFAVLAFALLFFLLGNKIHREENSLFKPAGNENQALDTFRKTFGKYRSTVQPKITSVKLNLELFPESRSFLAKGEYLLVNKSSQKIDRLLVKTGYDEITQYSIGAPSFLAESDPAMQFAVHVLENPLLPEDSLKIWFEIKNKPNSLFYQNSSVLQNGTFLKADILPRLGYFFDRDILEPTDRTAQYLNFYSQDGDLVNIETIISTHQSQTALAPGYLQKKWTENGRNFFQFKTKNKIKFSLAFNSGSFSIHQSHYKGVDLAIYHHPNHGYNLNDMIEGLKAALDYNTFYFGPYQHGEVRIVEFPLTEGSYASVMSNSIPTSEVRFVQKNEDLSTHLNLSFYVQAHEMTHQWWGNQVVPAEALGAKMLTESITEYISLKIYERYYGREKALHFLSLQRKRYLEGRAKETGEEMPLYRVKPEQEYIAYGKGAMALNTLQYYVGEDKLNSILKTFLEKYKFRTDRYPTSVSLIADLKKSISPDFHYIISDMMESITFFDNKITGIKELSDKRWEISFEIKKLDHTLKNEMEVHRIFIEIGQYNREGQLIGIEQYRVSSGVNKVILSPKPDVRSIVLDPLLHFIELDIEDNRKNIK
jgi:ABC-2 type transport system permease protein